MPKKKSHDEFIHSIEELECKDGRLWLEKYTVVGEYTLSSKNIECYCKEHEKTFYVTPQTITKRRSGCGECKKNNKIKAGYLKFKKSFERWCLDNDHQDYLNLWDYELNDKKPSEIGCGTNDSFYFKCLLGVHDSEIKKIASLTCICGKTGSFKTSVKCNKCNSFGQYLLDTFCNLDMWSDNNTYGVWDVSKRSRRSVILKCSNCGKEKNTTPKMVSYYGIKCSHCGDGFSFSEKLFKSVLSQLNIDHVQELSKNTYCWGWIENYRYDYYIPSLNLIVELNGIQHYKEMKSTWKIKLKEQQSIDKEKELLAKKHGCQYIAIDCRESSLEWCKSSLINKLGRLIDMTNVDWSICLEYAYSNTIKAVCDYWMTKDESDTTLTVSNKFNISKSCVTRYLNKGKELGWCDYNGKEEMIKSKLK